MIPLRVYVRPALTTEAFDVVDIIMDASNKAPDFDSGDEVGSSIPEFNSGSFITFDEDNSSSSGAPVAAPKLEVFGAVDAVGTFNQEVTGGNPVQEGLNNIYENFLSKF